MPNNRLDFESIDQVEVFKENGDVIGTVKVSGVRSIEAAIEKALQQLPEATDPEAYVFKVFQLVGRNRTPLPLKRTRPR